MMLKESVMASVLVGAIILALEKPEVVVACNANDSGSQSSTCYCAAFGDVCNDAEGSNAVLTIDSYLQNQSECTVKLGTTRWVCLDAWSASLLDTSDSTSTPLALCGDAGGPGTDPCTGDEWFVRNTPRTVVANNVTCGPNQGFGIVIEMDEECGEDTQETNYCEAGERLKVEWVLCE